MESPPQPISVGLASITHLAPSSTPSTSARASNLVGEIGLEFEDVDEGFVEPLTISQIEFCLFNEANLTGLRLTVRATWSVRWPVLAPRTPRPAQRALAGSVVPRAT